MRKLIDYDPEGKVDLHCILEEQVGHPDRKVTLTVTKLYSENGNKVELLLPNSISLTIPIALITNPSNN